MTFYKVKVDGEYLYSLTCFYLYSKTSEYTINQKIEASDFSLFEEVGEVVNIFDNYFVKPRAESEEFIKVCKDIAVEQDIDANIDVWIKRRTRQGLNIIDVQLVRGAKVYTYNNMEFVRIKDITTKLNISHMSFIKVCSTIYLPIGVPSQSKIFKIKK